MFLRRLNDSFPVMRVRNGMDRLFDSFLDTVPFEAVRAFGAPGFPAVDIMEEEAALHLEAEVPGLTMDDVRVFVLGNELTIEGERKAPSIEAATYHRQERGIGKFTRVVHLPVEVDAEKVYAQLRDGVLSVHLPKAKAAMPRRIEVKS
jgi:HSP20 family protein